MSWLRYAANRAYVGSARSRGRHVATMAGGLSYVVDVDDDGPGRGILLHGSTPELHALPLALRILGGHGALRSRSWFIDVGANIGTTVVPALALHGFERAIAIEPEADNVRVLRANLALNDVDGRAEVVAAAASDAPGIAAFRRGKTTRGGWRAGAGARTSADDIDATLVDAVALDDLLAERGIAPADVGLLWLDVQGHEGHVLMGAPKLMETKPPLVFAARARKLAKAGTLEFLIDAIAATYPCVVDLRASGDHEVRPGSDVGGLVQPGQTTDVLAFDPGEGRPLAAASASARVTSSG